MSIMHQQGFEFGFNPKACKACQSYCCRGESGRIWVSTSDINAICTYLKTNVIDGMQTYFKHIDNRISIRERVNDNDFECIFLDSGKNRCKIYEVRPLQCRKFPFWEYFKNHGKDKTYAMINQCPGIVE